MKHPDRLKEQLRQFTIVSPSFVISLELKGRQFNGVVHILAVVQNVVSCMVDVPEMLSRLLELYRIWGLAYWSRLIFRCMAVTLDIRPLNN